MTPLGPVTTQDRTYGVYYIPDVSGHANHDQVVYAHPNGLCVVCLAERHPMVTGELVPGGGQDDDAGEGAAGDDATGGGREDTEPGTEGDAGAPGEKRKRDDDDAHKPEPPGTQGGRPSRHRPPARYAPIASVDFSCGKGEGKGNAVNISGKKKRGAKTLQEISGLCRLVDESGVFWTARACVRGKLIETNERLAKDPSLCAKFPTESGFLAIISTAPADMQKLKETGIGREAYAALRGIEAR